MNDDDRPRRFSATGSALGGDAATLLAGEDLAPYSLAELAERIALLEAEIARVETHRARASAHLSAADALFRKPGA